MTQDAAVRACRRPGVLRMDFQPIVDTARGTVAGYESLARFSGPPHATPDRWFAVAHAAGFGAELEARALRIALEAGAWLPPNCFLSVNVGPDALTSSPVAEVFADAGDLRGVVVEITEQTAVACYDALVTALAPARAAGARSPRTRRSPGLLSSTSTAGRSASSIGAAASVRRSACCRRNGWPTWPGASRPARPPSARPRLRCATNARGSSGW